jgi:hypothetical protein
MRHEVNVSGPMPSIGGLIGGGAIFWLAAILCPPLAIPLGLGGALLCKKAYESGAIEQDRQETGDTPLRLAQTWQQNRQRGESGISVSRTKGTGGLFFDLPQTVTYDFRLTPDDSRPTNPKTHRITDSFVVPPGNFAGRPKKSRPLKLFGEEDDES